MDRNVLVLILNYNGANDAIACVQSVLKSDYRNFTIALVDNFSTDDSLSVLNQNFSRLGSAFTFLYSSEVEKLDFLPGQTYLVANHENRGFAAGNNLVLNHILNWDSLVWLLNPDITVEPQTLKNLVKDMGANNSKVLGNKVYSMTESDRLLHVGGGIVDWKSATVRPAKDNSQPLDYIYGGSLFTHCSLFRQFGLLPEHYFLYWEETDWCYTLKLAGIPLELSPNARVFDKVGGSIGRGRFAFYYYTLNGLRFVTKFKPEMKYSVVFFNCVRIIKRLLSFQFQIATGILAGTIDYFRGRYQSNVD